MNRSVRLGILGSFASVSCCIIGRIHDARLIVDAANRRIAHTFSIADLVNDESKKLTLLELTKSPPTVLKTMTESHAKVLRETFHISTVESLADFKPFKEAQQFLTPAFLSLHQHQRS